MTAQRVILGAGSIGSTELLLRNLERATGLVDSFKRLAVDKNDTQRHRFELAVLVDQACTEARAQHPHH